MDRDLETPQKIGATVDKLTFVVTRGDRCELLEVLVSPTPLDSSLLPGWSVRFAADRHIAVRIT